MIEGILPFNPNENRVQISQGYGGPWSHQRIGPGNDLYYALDFALPPNTPVIAVRSGVVESLYTGSNLLFYEGLDPMIGRNLPYPTNYVAVDHGTFTGVYVHIWFPRVRIGQKVDEGQLIAHTGLSGWVGPLSHLHFQAQRRQWPSGTIPMRINNLEYQGSLAHHLIPDYLK